MAEGGLLDQDQLSCTGNLQEKICSQHDKSLEVYCRTDQQCICSLCVKDEHRCHDTVSAAAERNVKQKQLGVTQSQFQLRIQEREDMRHAVQSIKRSAQAAVEHSEKIRDHEKALVSQAEGLLERLEQEIAELRRRDAELEQLSQTEDNIHFLQSYQSLCVPPGPGDLPVSPVRSGENLITVSPHVSFKPLRKSVSELKERLEDMEVKEVHILELKTRDDFLQYSCQLTLDPNTAYKHLCLSEGNREVTYVGETQPYSYHPERFDFWHQVLCREGLSGRCYWEVEWSGKDGVNIAVSYKEMSREGKGNDSALGFNDKSWSLGCRPLYFSFWHNNDRIELPIPPSSTRIGVYLDHRAGTLSFYSISDTMTLLHRVQTTFTQPLYPGFGVWIGSYVKLCDLG